MQDLDRLRQGRDVNDPERAGGLYDPYLPDAGADTWHGFPIVGIAPHLNKPELMPGLAARNLRKIPNPPFRVAKPGELFHHRRYRFRYRFRKGPLACIMSSADNNRMTEKSFYAGCGALPSRSAGVFQSPLVATLQEELDIDGLPRVELASG
jgi:hypothetical protein